jgi:hypothetical protein
MSETSPINTAKPFKLAEAKWYQRVLLGIYALGFVGMLALNYACYPGTFVGKWGWAAIWPFSIFGYFIEFVVQRRSAVLTEQCLVLLGS